MSISLNWLNRNSAYRSRIKISPIITYTSYPIRSAAYTILYWKYTAIIRKKFAHRESGISAIDVIRYADFQN